VLGGTASRPGRSVVAPVLPGHEALSSVGTQIVTAAREEPGLSAGMPRPGMSGPTAVLADEGNQ
jgi:hypothetical protein